MRPLGSSLTFVHVVLAAQAQAVVDRVLVVGFQIRDDRRFVELAQQLDVQFVHVRGHVGPTAFQQIRHVQVARCRTGEETPKRHRRDTEETPKRHRRERER